ncbi:hypothetical protein ABZV34_37975 [Streptomyces sp. NPDC005195]
MPTPDATASSRHALDKPAVRDGVLAVAAALGSLSASSLPGRLAR